MAKSKAIIIGARPEAIKLIPLYKKLKLSDRWQPVLISTGQHKEMLQQIFDLFEAVPDHSLAVMVKNQRLSGLISLLFLKIQECIDLFQPKLIVVQGDNQSSFIGGYTGFYNKIKVAHIEAGTLNNKELHPFPKEINRQAISLISDFDFTPTEETKSNLIKLGKKEVYNVRNTVIDVLFYIKNKVTLKKDLYFKKFSDINFSKKIVLITGHKRENFDATFENVLNSIKKLSNNYYHFEFIFPVYLNPMVKEVVVKLHENQQNIKLLPPLLYYEMVFFMEQSHVIITDSGGIQEENRSLNTPVLVTRESTERKEGVVNGCLIMVGTDSKKMEESFSRLCEDQSYYDKVSNSQNQARDVTTSDQIMSILNTKFQ